MGSRMEKKVTIVIPNYNGKRFLDDCLSSLERQTSKDFETLVIDNASQDDSVSYIREHYPWVKIAVMRHNLGFSGGVNVGIGMCTMWSKHQCRRCLEHDAASWGANR